MYVADEVWLLDNLTWIPYTMLSDRSVETCEAYRRGRACGSLPLLVSREKNVHTPKKFTTFGQQVDWLIDEKGIIVTDRVYAEEVLHHIG